VQDALDVMAISVDQNVGNEMNGDSSVNLESNILKPNNVENISGRQDHSIEYASCSADPKNFPEAAVVKDDQEMRSVAAEGREELSREEPTSSQESCVLQGTLCDEDDMMDQAIDTDDPVEEKVLIRDESAIFAEVVHHIDRARSALQMYQQDLGQQPIHQNTDGIHARDRILSLWYESSKLTTFLYELSEKLR